MDDVRALVGKDNPGIYDWDPSHYAMEIGLAVHPPVQRDGRGLDLLYVSTTDFVQHKEGPGEPMADQFYRRFDELLGAYLDAGFVVGFTADHGMNAKQEPDGSPRVIYLEDVLEAIGVREYHVVAADHRSVRAAPRRARLVRLGLRAGRQTASGRGRRSWRWTGWRRCTGARRRR